MTGERYDEVGLSALETVKIGLFLFCTGLFFNLSSIFADENLNYIFSIIYKTQ